MSEKIGTYFVRSEFECRCGCGKADMDYLLIEKLDDLRMILGRPIIITSGYRCAAHNKAVGGAADSAHTKGMAADIKVGNSTERYELLSKIFSHHFFRRIGVSKEFIHVDVDMNKPHRVVWTY